MTEKRKQLEAALENHRFSLAHARSEADVARVTPLIESTKAELAALDDVRDA